MRAQARGVGAFQEVAVTSVTIDVYTHGGEAAYSNAMCSRRFTLIVLFAGLLVISIVSSAGAERSKKPAAPPPAPPRLLLLR